MRAAPFFFLAEQATKPFYRCINNAKYLIQVWRDSEQARSGTFTALGWFQLKQIVLKGTYKLLNENAQDRLTWSGFKSILD